MLALLSRKRRHSGPRGSPQPGPSHFRNRSRPSAGPCQQPHPVELSQEGMADHSLSRAAKASLVFVKHSELKIFAAALGSQVLLPAIFSPSLSASVERDRDVLSKARTVPKVLTCFLPRALSLTGKKSNTQDHVNMHNPGTAAAGEHRTRSPASTAQPHTPQTLSSHRGVVTDAYPSENSPREGGMGL